MKCPVQTRNGSIDCKYEFESNHYTDIQPHLETHKIKDLARSMTRLMQRIRWADQMGKEIIDACNTITIKGESY